MFPTWVASRLDAIAARLRSDDCALVVHTGPPRKGKSTLALRIARYIDPTFNVDRVGFEAGAFKQSCVTAPPGSAVGLDEAIHGGNSRRAMSQDNVDMQNWLTVWGHRNLYGYICYPKWSRLDGAIKDYASVRIHHPAKGIAVWYDVYHPDWSRGPVLAPGRKFRFDPLPPGPFRSAYEAKKSKFTGEESEPPKPARTGPLPLKKDAILAALKERPGVSSYALARELGVTPGYVSQLRTKTKDSDSSIVTGSMVTKN